MKSKVTIAIIVAIFSLSSCANEIGQKEGLGTILEQWAAQLLDQI